MRALQVWLLVLLTVTLAGCDAILTIFEAGVWIGVIIVLVILALVAFLVSLFRRRR
jgi:hypothetical protein